MSRWYCWISILLLLTGCSQSDWPSTPPSPEVEDVPILWQKSGTFSRLVKPVRILVRDQATLAQVPIAEIDVDFKDQMLLVAGLGTAASAELGIRIVRVWREGSELRVQEREIHPGLDAAPAREPSSPWTIVAIPRSDLNVRGYPALVPKNIFGEHPGAR